MTFLFKLIAAIEIADKWAERALKSYRDFKEAEEQKRLEDELVKASKEGSISRLRARNRHDL